MTVLSPGVRYLDVRFQGTLDPGPASTLARLRAELASGGVSIADVEAILITHIHLDHAGATGALVQEYPRIKVYVHERGAPHLIDPAKLLSSATRLYGDQMDVLWGPFLASPAANVVALAGGEKIDVGGREISVAYTPGHASHHVAYFDASSRIAFVGDVGGVALPRSPFVLPPTPPPDIDLDAWQVSVDRLLAWHPETLFTTHFGPHASPATHLQRLLERLRAWAELARDCLAIDAPDEARRDRFVAAVSLELRRAMPDAEAARYELAVPPWQCWQGLERYWRKQAGH